MLKNMLAYRLMAASLRLLRWRLGLSRAVAGVVLVVLPLQAGLTLTGCSDDAQGVDDGSGAAGGVGGAGGSSGSTSADAGPSSGGSGGSASFGGSAGSGGASSGGSGGSTTSTSGGGEAGGPSERLDFCERLSGTSTLAGRVALEFDLLTQYDCRVWDIPSLYIYDDAREVFLNDLLQFNMALWGCSPAPRHFGLVYWDGLSASAPPLTTTDAEVLIEDYLTVATPILSLSSAEIESITATLTELASERVIESDELSRSTCDPPGGTAGGGGEAGSPN